ncbi:MFS transporter [Streptomyces palmae]|uniref:MFS transporter n=1 Tax=Streptomyces palmae TaxID=1701085 RepID=UPI003CC91C21
MPTPPTLPKFKQQSILAVLMLCSLLIWLENTVLSTTLETLADPVRGLDAGPAELQWATGACTLAFATLMFTAGAPGDRFGHRTVLAIGLVVFAGSSVWAAYAGDADQLIAARVAMGVGSGLITPANLAILMWAFTGPARSTAIAVFFDIRRCRNGRRPGTGRGSSRPFLVGFGLSGQCPARGVGIGRYRRAGPGFPQPCPAAAGPGWDVAFDQRARGVGLRAVSRGAVGAAVLVFSLRPAGKPAGLMREQDHGRAGRRPETGRTPRPGTDDQSAYER